MKALLLLSLSFIAVIIITAATRTQLVAEATRKRARYYLRGEKLVRKRLTSRKLVVPLSCGIAIVS